MFPCGLLFGLVLLNVPIYMSFSLRSFCFYVKKISEQVQYVGAMLIQCWSPSTTLAQHWINIGPTYCACWAPYDDMFQVVKLCIAKHRDYVTVDLTRIGHHQTQQSITNWCMIGFGHYRTVQDILPKVSQVIKMS